ncbi:MAG TPA: response regulator transcription factor [Candidatus Avibacteroides excrementipullorum]|mgnify:CR=1 FL=1|nr:response regulator transcription factor [Candidatus Avibacteroides excrementipullorum]
MAFKKILVVDDEQDLCEIMKYNLENENFIIDTANSAEEALTLDLTQYCLILLDVMMGEISGFKMASMLKKDPKTAGIPIIFMTAKDTENDICTGLNIGADDYISKPFSIRETVLRIKAVLRRAENAPAKEAEQDVIRYKGLVIDIVKKQVFIDNELVQLTKKEFELLALFVSNQGKVFSRDEILEKIWKNESYVLDRTVDVNITRLRKKIGEYGKYIITRMGYGYYFDAN